MADEPRIQDRDIIKRVLVYALRFKAYIKWPRGSERDTEIAADKILDHLETSNVRMKVGPPLQGHSNKTGSPE